MRHPVRLKTITILTACLSATFVTSPPTVAAATHGKKVTKAKPTARRSATPSSAWRSDPALADDLGPETQTGAYALRIPLGYHSVPPPGTMSQPGFDVHLFAHDRLPDGTSPDIAIIIVTPPPDATGSLPLSEALDGVIVQKRRTMADFTESPVEQGRIGALTFARAYFKGTLTGAIGTRVVHGLAYACVDGHKIISIQAEDAEPHSSTTLPIIEAGILMIHKQ